MTIINPQQEHRREIFKAAETASEYQDAWSNWLLGHTVNKAFEVIAKGERLLIAQNETGLKMQDPDKVRHRIMVCKQFIEDSPKDTKPSGRMMSEQEAIKRVGKRITESLKKQNR